MGQAEQTKIAEYSKTEAGLAELRSKYAGATYDTATPAGMKAAVAGRAELRTLRVDLEKMRKAIKAPALERCRAIDSEAARITAELEALETPIDAQIKAEESRREEAKRAKEAAERERMAKITESIEAIRRWPLRFVSATADVLASEAARLGGIDLEQLYDETHRPAAQAAVIEAVASLASMRDARLAADAERARLAEEKAELERQRAAQEAELAEQRRLAEAERAEADRLARLERERLAAEQRRRDEEAAAARAEADRIARAERDRHEAEARAEAERRRREEEAERVERERLEAEERTEIARRRAALEAEEARVEAERAERDRRLRAELVEKTSLLEAARGALHVLETLAPHYVETEVLRAAIARSEA